MGAVFGFFIFVAIRQKVSFKDFLHTFPIGLQRSIVWGGLFYAFQEDNPAIGITIMSFSLIVSIVVFGPLLGEKVTPKILLLAGLGVVGVVLTSNESLTQFEFSASAWICIALLPVSAAGTYILRRVLNTVPERASATYMYSWIGILYTPVMFFVNPEFGFTNHEIFVLIVLMVFGAGGHFLFSMSQSRTSYRFNAIASTVHIPATAIFTWWFIGGTLQPHQILGMVIVISVVTYLSIARHEKQDGESGESLVLEP